MESIKRDLQDLYRGYPEYLDYLFETKLELAMMLTAVLLVGIKSGIVMAAVFFVCVFPVCYLLYRIVKNIGGGVL